MPDNPSPQGTSQTPGGNAPPNAGQQPPEGGQQPTPSESQQPQQTQSEEPAGSSESAAAGEGQGTGKGPGASQTWQQVSGEDEHEGGRSNTQEEEEVITKKTLHDFNIEKASEKTRIIIAAVIILAIGAVAYKFVVMKPAVAVATTTVMPTSFSISSCTAISSPGTYYLTSNISTSAINGPCIDISSGGVKLVGEGYSIVGDGPFTINGPSSYGISISSKPGVNVTDLSLAKFSYGVYVNGSSNAYLGNITVSNSTLAGIYLKYSSGIEIYDDHVKSSGVYGAINITGGGNNTVQGSVTQYNSYTGISIINSSGNRVLGSSSTGNPIDLACSGSAVYSDANRYSNSSCYVNSHCNFAYCTQQNNQTVISGIHLYNPISSCGSIDYGGSYELSRDLSLSNYMNVTLPQGTGIPCLLINSSNVYIYCNGHSIDNSYYGILSNRGAYNITLDGCTMRNDTYGTYLQNVIKFRLASVSALDNKYGIYLMGSTDGNVTNSTAERNSFGIYLNDTTYADVGGFRVTNNTYGISIDNSTDIYMSKGIAQSSAYADIYCAANTYNSTLLSLSNSQCTSTDCTWATECPVKRLPNLVTYPVTGCTTITVPGQYALRTNILYSKSGTCFDIKSDFVSFTCTASMTSVSGAGTAFAVNNASNVSISGCTMSDFANGFVVSNATGTVINGSVINSPGTGVVVNNSKYTVVSNSVVSGFKDNGFLFEGSNESTVVYDHSRSASVGRGFSFGGVYGSMIESDTANSSAYGFYFNDSMHNYIFNNSAISSSQYDYFCAPDSGGIFSQYGRVNYGDTKAGCRWMVEVPYANAQTYCSYINSPSTISMTHDLLYTFGDKCFTLYSNASVSASGTTINCNGHTVVATHGGSFVYSYNTSSVTLENCILVGFTDPVVFVSGSSPSGIDILNNTIANTAGNAIYVSGAQVSKVMYNNLTNTTGYGISLYRFNSSEVTLNRITDAHAGISINESVSTSITNNTVNGVFSGVSAQNSQYVTLSDNNVTNSAT